MHREGVLGRYYSPDIREIKLGRMWWADCVTRTGKIKNVRNLRYSLFREVTHRRLVVTDVSGQHIGPIFKDCSLKKSSICCPETSVADYQSMLRNLPEERITHTAPEV